MKNFLFQSGTGAYGSCSALINGAMMIFGGDTLPYVNQISVVESCQLRRIGNLPMDFYLGACTTIQNNAGNDETLLCFDGYGPKDCHR